jgi:hypothetical protein
MGMVIYDDSDDPFVPSPAPVCFTTSCLPAGGYVALVSTEWQPGSLYKNPAKTGCLYHKGGRLLRGRLDADAQLDRDMGKS